ncbi:VCBS repeat-containing protein [Candidatus Pacearchaeota archaeon]|nr:VCBS repeat-containing protein [Candidatus Pacearchaeota archaeon]
MDQSIKVILAAGISSLTLLGFYWLGEYHSTPTSVTIKDINNDGREDVVIKNNKPVNYFEKYIFLRQEDGNFKSFEDYQREQLNSVSQFQQKERKAIESQLAEIVKNAE